MSPTLASSGRIEPSHGPAPCLALEQPYAPAMQDPAGDSPGMVERRPATAADVSFLLELRLQVMAPHQRRVGIELSDEEQRARVLDRYECAEIILCAGRPAGLIKVLRRGTDWKLLQIHLLPEHQGRGLGSALIGELVCEAERAGACLRLSVLKGNPARRLYERLGFVAVAESEHSVSMRLRACDGRP